MKLRVEFEVTVPDGVTLEQAEEWLLYQLGERGGMSAENPLSDTDLEARRTSVASA
jgi:hypothetical protein